jgi:hypothetical protein
MPLSFEPSIGNRCNNACVGYSIGKLPAGFAACTGTREIAYPFMKGTLLPLQAADEMHVAAQPVELATMSGAPRPMLFAPASGRRGGGWPRQ